jgi:hypothetical protein
MPQNVSATATLTGVDAGNYSVSNPVTSTARINPRAITGSITAADKVYDGTTDATITSRTLSGVLAGDLVSYVGGTATFAQKHVGTWTVTATGLALGGAQAGNYTVNTTATTTASITKRGLTPTVNAADKIYDGNTLATITACNLDAVIPSDSVSCAAAAANFDTPAAGHNKPVTATGISHSGSSAGDYQLLTTTAATVASILYPSSGLCLGQPGHQILQPINADGTSVVKKGSTVPAKFRVCDVAGNSVGLAGVVVSFNLVQIVSGTSTAVNETVLSTTPDTAFRWDSTDRQWIFNISTKNLTLNQTYVYEIRLNDGSSIFFEIGVR